MANDDYTYSSPMNSLLQHIVPGKLKAVLLFALYPLFICSFIFIITFIHYVATDISGISNFKIEMFIVPMGLGFAFSILLAHNSLEIQRLRNLPFQNIHSYRIDPFDEIKKIFQLKAGIRQYIPFILGNMGIVLPLATLHMLLVLDIPFKELSPLQYIIPTLVSTLFGIFLGIFARLRRGLEEQNVFLITKEKELQELNLNLENLALERSEKIIELEKFAGEILNSQESIVILTNGSRLIRVNNKFLELFNEFASLEEFLRKNECIGDFFVHAPEKNYLEKYMNGENWISHILKNPGLTHQACIDFQGNQKVYAVTAKILSKKISSLFVATLTDITSIINYRDQLEDYSRKLKNQLYRDALTGLPNRIQLKKDLEENNIVNLILINIDSFQEMNNFFGHNIGDIILIDVSKRIQSFSDDYRFKLYRTGGDIFAALITERISKENLIRISEEISSIIADKNFSVENDSELSITVTQGIVMDESIENLRIDALSMADFALLSAKDSRKKYMIYSPEQRKTISYGNNISQAKIFKNALENKRILTYYQPILNNRTNKIEKYECLARIKDSNGNIILPDHFINAAKASKLYPHITHAVIDSACRMLSETDSQFSINLNIQDILDTETTNFIFSHIQNGCRPDRIIFEILEYEGIQNFDHVISFINRVKSYGCKIAIDDFGSGYSNYNYILKLDVDYIKIDQLLIKNINQNKNADIVVKNIIHFSKDLGIQTIAEHIHTREIFEKLNEFGVDYSQGFHIGIPSPVL